MSNFRSDGYFRALEAFVVVVEVIFGPWRLAEWGDLVT